jgi:nitroreductase
MEVREAIRKRKSIRGYEDKPVPEDKLLRVLEAARLAPSASNRQEWKFIVVRESKRRQELVRATEGQPHVGQAPVLIAAVATLPDYVMRSGIPAYIVDLAIAVDHMTLAAVDEGLSTCWIGRFVQDEAKQILKVPEKYRIVVLLALGFGNEPGLPKMRKQLDEIVCYEAFKK